jgi:ribosome-associated protein
MKHNPKVIKDLCIKILDFNKAENISVIDLTHKNNISDFVIIASGSSNRHIVTLKDKIVESLKNENIRPSYIEGEESANWIIIDLEYIIVHLFRQEVRDYYDFDNLWK